MFCFFFFFLLNLCQFNTKHFQLGFKRSVEIYWLPKWIVNGIGCWERAVILLPLAILHYIKMSLLLNGILRCQCFLQALIFIFFCLAFLFHTDAFCMVAYWLQCFMRQWICRQEQAQPIPWAQPGGQCKAKPRLVGFDSCRSLLAWPGCSKDFYCFQQRAWSDQAVPRNLGSRKCC